MSTHISEPPPHIEHYSEYVITKLNQFIEEVSKGEVVIDSIVESKLDEFEARVTIRFKEDDSYQSTPELTNISDKEKSNDLCVVIEDDTYVHILTTTSNWSSFDKNRIFELCISAIIEHYPTGSVTD